MHSCGNLWGVMDDVIDNINTDAKHSYEDIITPVEQAYERLKNKIGVIGGIDMDYLCVRTPEEIYNRAVKLLLQTKKDGGYALGSGNSIAKYIPNENYYAMISAALANKY